ncbi:hypoyhetical protein [Bifidobacterium catenulatum subsp. kashiwanohense]|nr:hypoyhetical protein [Bifidobacterium catenulatum subsp. kashiwanohense]
MCVDAVWGAGHERGSIGGVVVLVYPSEIVGGDGADGLHLVGEGFTEGGDGEFIAFSGLVEFGEHEFVGEASVCGDDGVGSCSPDWQGCSRPVSGAEGECLFACSVAYG